MDGNLDSERFVFGRSGLRRWLGRRSRRGAVLALGLATLVGLGAAGGSGMACASRVDGAIHGARHYAAGSEALAAGRSDEAIRELERAATLAPHASEIQNHLGLAHWTAGDPDAARRAFERALELDCNNGAARQNLERITR